MSAFVRGRGMNTRSASLLAASLAAIALALLIGGLVAQAYVGESVGADVLILPVVAAFPIVGVLIARRQPHNAIGWLFLAIGLTTAIGLGADAWFHAELPGSAWAAALGELVLSGLLGLPFVLLLFPSGRLLSPRWRWALWVAVAASVAVLFGALFSPSLTEYPGVRNPLGIEAIRGTPLDQGGIGWALLLVALVASAVSLVLRYRKAEGEERQQLKWLAWSAALIGIGWLLLEVTYSEGEPQTPMAWMGQVPFIVGFLSLPILVGVAILKYRLYEIDVVIKKTVVFAILVGLLMAIGAVAAIALGGSLTNRLRDRPEVALMTGVVLGLLAIPLYRLSRRIADRLVFRGRASPYEVLRSFAGRVGETYSTDDVLPRMARVLAEATGASRARVWVRVGDELRVRAGWPLDGASPGGAELLDGAPPADLDDHVAEVRHGGELLGVLSIRMPPNDPMNPTKESLVGDLASQAGLVLRNVRLIEELRESRRRIVAAQDERANKLERDIHDGAQQQLVALAVKERLAESLIGKDEERLRAMLRQLRAETELALQDLRDLARGIYPPLLADEGLTAALGSQVRRAVVPVTVEADGIARYAREVEAAVYFSVLEALQNASKYSAADHATVALRQSDGVLFFEVADDGRGFDPETVAHGSGLRGMADRIEAVGGELRIESALGHGTRVRGHLPVTETLDRGTG
jgi:signal transduction histidine kinase